MHSSQIHIWISPTPASQNVTVFGDKVFREVIKLKECHWGGDSSPVWLRSLQGYMHRKMMGVKSHWGDHHLQAKERSLRKTQHCQHLELGLPTSRTERKKKKISGLSLPAPPSSVVLCNGSPGKIIQVGLRADSFPHSTGECKLHRGKVFSLFTTEFQTPMIVLDR